MSFAPVFSPPYLVHNTTYEAYWNNFITAMKTAVTRINETWGPVLKKRKPVEKAYHWQKF